MIWNLPGNGLKTGQVVLEDLDEGELALKLARKKLSKLSTLDQPAFRKKMYGFLSRRGFSYGISKDIISTLWEELELQS